MRGGDRSVMSHLGLGPASDTARNQQRSVAQIQPISCLRSGPRTQRGIGRDAARLVLAGMANARDLVPGRTGWGGSLRRAPADCLSTNLSSMLREFIFLGTTSELQGHFWPLVPESRAATDLRHHHQKCSAAGRSIRVSCPLDSSQQLVAVFRHSDRRPLVGAGLSSGSVDGGLVK
jgi:hypothetical protein